MKKLKNSLIKHTDKSRLYQIPVPIIGLTGGISTGKSTVADLFRKKGIPVIDADKNVKNIYQMPETITFIKNKFPEVVHNHIIDFKKLREIVFSNTDAKILIEEFIYAHLPNEFKQAFYLFDNPPFIVYDVPLLFEKQLHLLVDVTICVYSSRKQQIERLIKRDQIDRSLAEKILANQQDIEVKKKLADFVILNTEKAEDLEINFNDFFLKLF
jgi:dephospho-CoA kinase